ncbi:MAG: hypothetical protein PVI90_17920 [Desulfobacteraceae bacterium]|jgi:hypothetical protein
MRQPKDAGNASGKAKLMGFVLCLLFLVESLSGCGWLPTNYRPTPEKLIRDITTASHYRKKIGVATIQNYAGIDQNSLENVLFQVLTDTMRKECGNALLITAEAPEAIDIFTSLPRLENGVIDSFTLSNAGRNEGYNAILTGSLATITTREERKGLWWFRKNHHYLQILIFIDVYDTHDASKIFSQAILKEFEIKAEDADKIKTEGKVDLSLIKEHIEEIAENAGVDVCDAVDGSIWKGFVTESNNKEVTLSCGSVQGIRSGDQFEIFDSSRTMDNYQGQKFFVPGYKIGEIEISQVRNNHSKAKVLTSDPLPVGSIVIPKY